MSEDEENIDEILNELSEEQKENKEVEKTDITNKEELAKRMLDMTNSDREMADKIFELFYPNIGSGQDRSQASKEAITRALELKINAGRNIIDLIKLLKEEEKSGNVGIFIKDEKAGVDINNIMKDVNDDE